MAGDSNGALRLASSSVRSIADPGFTSEGESRGGLDAMSGRIGSKGALG